MVPESIVSQSEARLGPLLSVHEHTWTYRVFAVLFALMMLAIAVAVAVIDSLTVGVCAGLIILGCLARFVHCQSRESLLIHEDGLCLRKGDDVRILSWSSIERIEIQWAYSGDPPGFFEAQLFDSDNHRLVLRANWTDRQIIDQVLLDLSALDLPGESRLPR